MYYIPIMELEIRNLSSLLIALLTSFNNSIRVPFIFKSIKQFIEIDCEVKKLKD